MSKIKAILGALIVLLGTTFADTPSNKSTNAFGALVYQDNPYTYMYGMAVSGNFVESGDKVGTNVVFQPARTYALFTQSLLFCGDVSGSFEGASLVIVTYEKQTHQLINGVACHNLIAVDKLSTGK